MADDILDLINKIETVSTPAPLTTGESALGYARSAISGPLFNFGDEAESAISALFQAAPFIGNDKSIPENYADHLAQTRVEQARFKDQTDYADNAVEIASSFLNPLNKVKELAVGVKGLETLGKVATSAPAQAALATVGMTEGNDNIASDAAKGALFGSVLSGVASTAGNALEKTGLNANRFKLSAFGIGATDINKQVKKLGDNLTDIGDELPLVETLNKYEKRGLINAGNDVIDNLKNVSSYQDKLGVSLSKLLEKTDEALPPSRGFDTTATEKYIASLSGTARDNAEKAAIAEYSALADQIKIGSLRELQDAKIGLNYKWDQNPEAESVIKTLRSDLRQEIENRVNLAAKAKLIPASAEGLVKGLNSEWGQLAELGDSLKRGVARKYGGNAVEDAMSALRTSGGAGSLNIMSAASGNPVYSAIGGLLNVARKPEALSNLGDAAREFQTPLVAAGKALPELVTGRSAAQVVGNGETAKKPEAKPQSSAKDVLDLLNKIEKLQTPTFEQSKAPSNSAISSLFSQGENMPVAIKGNISPDALYKAMVAQESGGNPAAVSDVGAVGLMQIMPDTAKDIAKALGVASYDLKDPETNKKFGEYYINYLLEKYGGDPELALTAYHSGMGRVDKLLEARKASKLADIIDLLGPVGQKYAAQTLARIG